MASSTREPLKNGVTRVTHPTGKVSYEARWSWIDANGKRKGKTETHSTLKAAKAARAKAVAAIEESRYEAPSRLTVDEYAAQWLPRKAREWASSTAYTRLRQYDNHVKPRFGGLQISRVTRSQCQGMADELADEFAPANVRNVMALVSALFGGAAKDGIISRNPAEGLDLPSVRPEPKVVWTADQVRTFLDATADHRDHTLYVVLLRTGMRIGEALAMRWVQVDIDGGTLTVTDTLRRTDHGSYEPMSGTKTTKDRMVPLTVDCIEALRTYQARQAEQRRAAPVWDIRGYVFTSPQRADGRPLDYADFTRRLRECLAQHPDLPPLTAHGFRRTVSAILRQGGIDPTTRAALLGHSVQVNVDSYTSISAADLLRATSALGDTLGTASNGRATTTSSEDSDSVVESV